MRKSLAVQLVNLQRFTAACHAGSPFAHGPQFLQYVSAICSQSVAEVPEVPELDVPDAPELPALPDVPEVLEAPELVDPELLEVDPPVPELLEVLVGPVGPVCSLEQATTLMRNSGARTRRERKTMASDDVMVRSGLAARSRFS